MSALVSVSISLSIPAKGCVCMRVCCFMREHLESERVERKRQDDLLRNLSVYTTHGV